MPYQFLIRFLKNRGNHFFSKEKFQVLLIPRAVVDFIPDAIWLPKNVVKLYLCLKKKYPTIGLLV